MRVKQSAQLNEKRSSNELPKQQKRKQFKQIYNAQFELTDRKWQDKNKTIYIYKLNINWVGWLKMFKKPDCCCCCCFCLALKTRSSNLMFIFIRYFAQSMLEHSTICAAFIRQKPLMPHSAVLLFAIEPKKYRCLLINLLSMVFSFIKTENKLFVLLLSSVAAILYAINFISTKNVYVE